MGNEFISALQKARFELTQVECEQKRLAQRKAQLLQTITALAPLVTKQPSREALSLADAIRTVIGSDAINRPDTVFTPKTVRAKLLEMGFDFAGYNDNHMAAIHTAMRRMQKTGELKLAGDTFAGGGYKATDGWLRSFFSTPEGNKWEKVVRDAIAGADYKE